SGFQVRPTLAGEIVTLEITPEESSFQSSGTEHMRVATEVQARLGEWTPLGGADLRAEQNSRSLLGVSSNAQSSQRGVWVKVEVAN
ncbi:MAG TPA: hypothetical protein PLQ67_08425, partial [Burkholderiaceae bacterium]|nr:hypothetical protein [Burkholderiaceae bacterium]